MSRESAARRIHTRGWKLSRNSSPSTWGRRRRTPWTLDGCVRADQAARHEPRLARRLERAGLVQPEGGTHLVAGKGAETRRAEKAVVAGHIDLFAHSEICQPFARSPSGDDLVAGA